MASLCHPWFTTTNLSYRFTIFETSATALCGTTGNILEHIRTKFHKKMHWSERLVAATLLLDRGTFTYFFRWHFFFRQVATVSVSAWNPQLLFTCQGATERLVDPGWCCWNAQINGYNLSKIRSQVDQQLCMFFLRFKAVLFSTVVGLSNLKEFEISAAVSSRNLKKYTGI